MRKRVRGILLVATLLAVSLPPSRSEAQIAESAYNDLRDVIEELIQTEITTKVVVRIRERSPVLAFYFRETLRRLSSSYWGNLKTKISSDLVVLVSDYVYWSADRASEQGVSKKDRSIVQFFSCFSASAERDPGCAQILLLPQSKARSLVDQYCRSLDRRATSNNEFACNLALATRAGLNQQPTLALRHVVDAVSDILLHDIEPGAVRRRLRKMAQTWLGDRSQFPATFPDLFLATKIAPNQLQVDWVKSLCKNTDTLSAYFADPGSSLGWICFAVSYAGLPNSLAFRVQIELPKGAGTINRYHRYWDVMEYLKSLDENAGGDARPLEQRLYSMFVNTTIMEHCARNRTLKPARGAEKSPAADPKATTADSATELFCRDQTLDYGHPVGAKITITWLGLTFDAVATNKNFKTASPLALARATKSFRLGIERIEAMRSLVPGDLRESIFVEDRVDLEPALQTLRAFLRIGRLVSELRTRWYLWPDDPNLSAATRLQSVDLGGLLALALEEAAPSEGTGGVRRLLNGKQALRLRRLLDLSFRADLRELAVEALRLALHLEERAGTQAFETFFLSLAGYLLDESDADGVTITKESFRAAAKDLLRTLPSDGVPTAEERWRFRLLPLLSTRVSFNNNYRNEAGRAGMRYLVAADWPVAYLAMSDYVGVRVSLVDLIGPLGELALRRVGTWQESKLLWEDFIRPRAGIWLAVPQFSRRLILDAGVGVRLLGVEDGTGDVAGRYRRDASAEIHVGLSYAL